ncbi:MAG: aspartyl/glutamyl-tRNA amidotransferase subunit C, partial [Actinobacteria bacterium]|nr:aspartyl/glutamyl-tRNA amidotransferase subunit C [Actinomycetota bacterium]
NVTRPDEIADVLTREQALANAPEAADGMFRVSSILGEEQ